MKGYISKGMLADPPIGDRTVRNADGGRRPKAIREIPVESYDGKHGSQHSVPSRV